MLATDGFYLSNELNKPVKPYTATVTLKQPRQLFLTYSAVKFDGKKTKGKVNFMKRYGALFILLLVWTACLPTMSGLTLRYKSTAAATSVQVNSEENSAEESGNEVSEPYETPNHSEESPTEQSQPSDWESTLSARAEAITKAVEEMEFDGKLYTVYDAVENRAFFLREEEYLVMALAHAFPNGAPSEAMKAQAIALRSVFLYRTTETAAPSHDGNSLCTDENHCAALAVPADLNPYIKAVNDTAGKYLSYNGKPALALSHDSSCSFTAEQSVLGGEPTPYLGSVPVLDESEFDDYKTVVRFTAEEFRKRFSQYDVNFESDHGTWINSIHFDSTNRLKTIEVGGLTFSSTTFCKLLNLESACPVIITTADGFTVSCYGKGSGIGMSRCSAILMAESGKSYGEILRYFYPGTSISFFYKS